MGTDQPNLRTTKERWKVQPLSGPASPEKWDVSSDLRTLIQTVS